MPTLSHFAMRRRMRLSAIEQNLVHHSGSGRLAKPSPWGTSTSYSLPASWRTLLRVRIDKTQGEYKESASPSIADMRADADFSGSGTGTDVREAPNVARPLPTLTARPWGSRVQGRSAASPERRLVLADRCRSRPGCLPTMRVQLHGFPSAQGLPARSGRHGSCEYRNVLRELDRDAPSFASSWFSSTVR